MTQVLPRSRPPARARMQPTRARINWLRLCTLALTLLLAPLASAATACTEALAPATPIEAVGTYATRLTTAASAGPAYWYRIDLWHAGACYFGHFRASRSHEGDAPANILSFRAAPKGGTVTFSVKMSDGVLDQGPGLPGLATRDLFEFSGSFDHQQMAGNITYTDKLRGTPPTIQSTKLLLKKNSARELTMTSQDNTWGAWTADAQSLLRAYGPKW